MIRRSIISISLWQCFGRLLTRRVSLVLSGTLHVFIFEKTGQSELLEIYDQVLAVDRAGKDKRSEGGTLRELGFVYYYLKNYARATLH